MTSSHSANTAVELVNHINAAITNVRLYPPTSELITNSVERLHQAFAAFFAESSSVVFAESGKKLLVQGKPLAEKMQKRPQIRAFLDSLLELGINSIVFEQGLSSQEINDFLQIFAALQQGEAGEGGIQERLSDNGITNIRVDEKVYIEQEGGQGPDPERLAALLYTGITGDPAENASGREAGREIPQGLSQLVEQLGQLPDARRQQITEGMAASLAGMEEARFQEVYRKSAQMLPFASPETRAFLQELLGLLSRRGRAGGRDTRAETDERGEGAGSGGGSAGQKRLKEAVNRLLKGDTPALAEIAKMPAAGQVMEKILEKGTQATVAALMEQLQEGLKSGDPQIRKSAVNMTAALDSALAESGRKGQRLELARRLMRWVRQQSQASRTLETVTAQLRQIAEALILDKRLEDAAPIVQLFYLMESGGLAKDEAMRGLAANFLQNLATGDILGVLLEEHVADADGFAEKKGVAPIVFRSAAIEVLLDRLRDSSTRAERNRIVQVISRIGAAAVEPVVNRLAQQAPWYYLRNLVMVLGRIGNWQHIGELERFLEGGDFRVQREAVMAIQNIGGQQAGAVLLDHLDEADDALKAVMVSVLGIMNYRQALPYLIMKLENRDLGESREARADINARICEAMGRMGDTRAMPVLERIAHSRTFLGIKSHDPKVKTAAIQALAAFAEK
ncbi:MAG TPA: HEAT repeat domain-containing protein [Desulfosalsimonadaceae bacterium]|nr:HEAT repeat domain-containing protein [Desulfosalsimonadaceae bacterium]